MSWGSNLYGQTNVPAGLSNVISVAAGNTFSFALTRDGTLAQWGRWGGEGTNLTPYLSNVVALVVSINDVLALKSNGTWWGGEITVTGRFPQVFPMSWPSLPERCPRWD